jgi:hypothetical protein
VAENDATEYEIHVKGRLGARWAEWFDGMTLTPKEDGTSVISGIVADQSALHGLLRRLGDLGMPLLSVTRTRPNDAEAPASTPMTQHRRRSTT